MVVSLVCDVVDWRSFKSCGGQRFEQGKISQASTGKG